MKVKVIQKSELLKMEYLLKNNKCIYEKRDPGQNQGPVFHFLIFTITVSMNVSLTQKARIGTASI